MFLYLLVQYKIVEVHCSLQQKYIISIAELWQTYVPCPSVQCPHVQFQWILGFLHLHQFFNITVKKSDYDINKFIVMLKLGAKTAGPKPMTCGDRVMVCTSFSNRL